MTKYKSSSPKSLDKLPKKKKKRLVASSAQKLNTQASQELNIMSRNKLENKHLLKNWQMS